MKSLFTMVIVLVASAATFAQKEGVKGEVFWLGGNEMPSPGKVASARQGVVREVLIYQSTHLNEASQVDGFFNDIKTQLVTTVTSDQEGKFQVKLPPGNYSLFVKETKGLFANMLDKDGCINCIHVSSKKFSWMTIAIDYEAVF